MSHTITAKTLLLVVLSLTLGAFAAAGDTDLAAAPKTYYVSTTGSDTNPGTKESPWATPGYGSRKLKAGDTLIIMPGTYVLDEDADTIKPKSGKATAWITIQNQGKRPVLAGRDNHSRAVDLSGAKFVKISGLEITHDPTATGEDLYAKDGVAILDKQATDIILDNLYIHHIDDKGLHIQDVDRLQVTNCTVAYCGGGAAGGPAGKKGGWKNVLISTTTLSYSGHYYRGGNGTGRPDKSPDGCGILKSAGPVEIAGCTLEHNYGDGIESIAVNTYIHETTVANNTENGIRFWVTGGKAENCLIYGMGDKDTHQGDKAGIMIEGIKSGNPVFYLTNVTVDDNRARQGFMAEFQRYANGWITLYMKNCIFANGGGAVCMYKTVKATVQNCLFLRPGARWQVEYEGKTYDAGQIESGKIGPGNMSRDPKFVKRAWGTKGDYHLAASSPCIDAGTPSGAPATDIDGTTRPQGAQVDMGAYEQ